MVTDPIDYSISVATSADPELPAGAAASGEQPVDGGGDLEAARLNSPGLDAVATEAVRAAIAASTAANTKAAYRSDWARFTAWASDYGYSTLPAAPEVVAHYLTDAAARLKPTGAPAYGPATLTRWVSSIIQFCNAAGHPAPGKSELVRRTLSGIRRTRATPPRRRRPLLLDDLRTLLEPLEKEYRGWPTAVAARRDTALLLMGFGGAHRRSELVGLTIADVTIHSADGLHVRLRTSKTDQEAHGAVRAIPFGRHVSTCAPCAVIRWRQLLDAWHTATLDPSNKAGSERRSVLKIVRQQNAQRIADARTSSDPTDKGERHCCRITDLTALTTVADRGGRCSR